MPNVSINLTEKAYDVFRYLDKGSRSRIMSAALLLWNSQLDEYYGRDKKGEEE